MRILSKKGFSIVSHLSPAASNVRASARSRSTSRNTMRSGRYPPRAAVLSESTLSIPRPCAHPCIASEETKERSDTTISHRSSTGPTRRPIVCARAAAKRYAFVMGSIVSFSHSFDWARCRISSAIGVDHGSRTHITFLSGKRVSR